MNSTKQLPINKQRTIRLVSKNFNATKHLLAKSLYSFSKDFFPNHAGVLVSVDKELHQPVLVVQNILRFPHNLFPLTSAQAEA